MTPLVYDGSFEGMLTAVKLVLEKGAKGGEILPVEGSEELLFGGDRVATSEEAARALLTDFHCYAGKRGLRLLLLLFLADTAPRERLIRDYIRVTMEQGKDIGGWLTHPVVAEAVRTARRVAHEAHRFTGLLRFRQLADGSFYAPFEPDYNIAAALAPHFARRMGKERWLIHDRRRDLGIFWDGREFVPAVLDQKVENPAVSDRENFFQECWRNYHRRIAVEGRRNPTLQRQFMPVRYWRYLTELTRT
ncbi:MAG: DNA metabolism protein [Desulfuromonadaceae bacterium]|nr:DNA metabolism protein [Desulfuromonadaceae bacterium]